MPTTDQNPKPVRGRTKVDVRLWVDATAEIQIHHPEGSMRSWRLEFYDVVHDGNNPVVTLYARKAAALARIRDLIDNALSGIDGALDEAVQW